MALDTKYFIICFAISSFILIPVVNVQAASSTRYYAGYYYNGSGRWGVKADIFIEWLEMPLNQWAAEWDCIILQYYPGLYWLQTGYIQHYIWVIFFPVVYWRFYAEKMDENGHWIEELLPLAPIPGHTYTYTILKFPLFDLWIYAIHEGSTQIYGSFFPLIVYHVPVDLQAFVETFTPLTHIDGSHFSKISYLYESSWRYWDRYDPKADPPYYLNEISDYEFYAYGGV